MSDEPPEIERIQDSTRRIVKVLVASCIVIVLLLIVVWIAITVAGGWKLAAFD